MTRDSGWSIGASTSRGGSFGLDGGCDSQPTLLWLADSDCGAAFPMVLKHVRGVVVVRDGVEAGPSWWRSSDEPRFVWDDFLLCAL